jgi:hypothetical protein
MKGWLLACASVLLVSPPSDARGKRRSGARPAARAKAAAPASGEEIERIQRAKPTPERRTAAKGRAAAPKPIKTKRPRAPRR